MLKIILRAIADVIIYAILIPLKILVILWLIVYAIIDKVKKIFTIKDFLEDCVGRFKDDLHTEIDKMLVGKK